MNWYNNQKEVWKEIIETVSAEENRSLQMVEKDTIQSIFLFNLSKSELPFVFKGGTSLSKVYELINRFSEDIDLSMSRKLTEMERKRANHTIVDIANKIGLNLANTNEIMSGYNYNKYIFEYNSLFNNNQPEIIIETSFYQISYPIERHKVSSLIEKFCKKRNIVIPKQIERLSCDIQVQALSRTFVDKIFAVCDYSIQNSVDRHSRHLYDIAKIIQNIKIDCGFYDLIQQVRKDRMLSKNNPSAKMENNITQILNEIIEKRIYEADYNSITRKLLYDNMTYDEAVKLGIDKVCKLKIF